MSSQEFTLPIEKKSEQDHIDDTRRTLLKAALEHVCFDGWSKMTLDAAIAATNIDQSLADQAFPRGAIDLALAYHRAGDLDMLAAIKSADFSNMRFRDKITYSIKCRLEGEDKELVRRAMSLFALPQNVGEGANALWNTCDAIWLVLGDQSEDINWYTKRASLSGVYVSTVLFWLGDSSNKNSKTWGFLDRRIENVMQFEKFKSKVKDNPLTKGFGNLFAKIKKPNQNIRDDLPGYSRK